eukprot:GILJ01042124.1.p1 GENE.GILJ01042124.1~~GILJ01042124.1.p1  ORF type:complete len:104 (+),score=33.72 GILJ01042124.1:71-382(+)
MVLRDKQFNAFDRTDVMDADLMCPLINGYSPKVVSILVRCLKQDPMQRPALEEIFCELSGQPSSRQAALMAQFSDPNAEDSEEEGEGKEEVEEEEDEEEEEDD